MNLQSIQAALQPDIDFKAEIGKLWSNHYQGDEACLAPLAPDNIAHKACVFLSLNPSIMPDAPKGIQLEYYTLVGSNTISEEKVHPHFKKFFAIAKAAALENWFCMDLLFVRQTDQRGIEAIRDSVFVFEQVRLALEIIKRIRPKLVVVSNRMASVILHTYLERMGHSPLLDEAHGVYHWEKIPLIVRESTYLGSRKMWYSRKDKREILIQEIQRVLAASASWR